MQKDNFGNRFVEHVCRHLFTAYAEGKLKTLGRVTIHPHLFTAYADCKLGAPWG